MYLEQWYSPVLSLQLEEGATLTVFFNNSLVRAVFENGMALNEIKSEYEALQTFQYRG